MRRVGIRQLALLLAVLFMASPLVCGLDLGIEGHAGSHSGEGCLFFGPGGTVAARNLPPVSPPAVPMTVIAFLALAFFFSARPYSGQTHRSPTHKALSHRQRLAYFQTFLI